MLGCGSLLLLGCLLLLFGLAVHDFSQVFLGEAFDMSLQQEAFFSQAFKQSVLLVELSVPMEFDFCADLAILSFGLAVLYSVKHEVPFLSCLLGWLSAVLLP